MGEPRDFAADRAVCEAATKGPWRAQWQSSWMGHRILFPAECESYCGRAFRLEDAKFIAAARTGWPAALDEIARLRTENIELRTALDAAEREAALLREEVAR